jgi:hypothetical protein
MNLQDLQAELSMKSLEFERAMDLGMPHSLLINLYKELKELQYKILMAQTAETARYNDLIIE